MQKITLIAAVDKNNAIGKDNKMAWHIPEDFAFFKQYTLNKPIIMGRKTWDSLPKKPLSERRNIILSQQTDLYIENAEVFNHIDQVFGELKNEAEIVIIGGAQIYRQFLPFATDIRLTEVNLTIENADAFFPMIDHNQWQIVEKKPQISAKNQCEFAFVHYIKK
ncbi:MAG: dihydrofolate reductase [Neisseriaceae bacterium]|nr:dihydrofolate reductase [Neisseriaceae bacterium]MBR3425950.1 dihydrofolate reductase [Neisseriaceae bacterium]